MRTGGPAPAARRCAAASGRASSLDDGGPNDEGGMTRWLITRPREEAERFADAMRDRGLDPVIAPILEIEPVDPGPIALDDVQAVLATSRNGLDAFARRVARRDLPVLA